MTTQRERASLMLPALVAFLAGTIVSGPLADWVEDRGAAALVYFRYRVVLVGRAIETACLGSLVVVLALGQPTVLRVLPYVVVSALMKTALLPTRQAFALDLLAEEHPQTDAEGRPMLDEHGEPLLYKTHIFAFWSLTSLLTTAAALGGLLAGGVLQRACAGVPWLPFLGDVLTNVVFVVIVAVRCRPADVPVAPASGHRAARAPLGAVRRVAGTFARSVREAARFLAQPAQRPLLGLLAGAVLIELVTEAYNGNMIVKHLLGGTDDQVRYAEIGWTVISLVSAALLPLLARRVGSLGKIFLVTMLLDGLAIVAAGAAAGAHRPLLAFTVAIGADRSLTMASGSLASLAMSSASSTRMRGRLTASFAVVAILGDMFVEALATVVSEAIGIFPMLVRLGCLQVALVLLIAALGRRKLWQFGLFSRPDRAAEPAVAAVS
jgi:hypothetical protein